MCTEQEVVGNVQVVLEAVGAQPTAADAAKQYKEAVEHVQAILAPVKDMTWPSGRPENNLPVSTA